MKYLSNITPRANATKRGEQLELNRLKEETNKNKYNVEVQNIYERLCIEETGKQPYKGSFNNQCDKKMDYCQTIHKIIT